jgi:3-methyladenine DNA glycosylase/8-oxoguanine DNA glycosylase
VPVRAVPLSVPLDLRLTLGPLLRGRGDPTMRLDGDEAVRAWRTPVGPVTVAIAVRRDRVDAEAWGAGATWALDQLPALLGLDDGAADAYVPRHAGLARLAGRMRGLRIGRTGCVLDALVPAVLEQRVTRAESQAGLRGLARAHGESAPGPHRLRLLPDAATLRDLPTWAYHLLGIEERRALTLRRVADRADRLEETAYRPLDEAYRRLASIDGVGPWTLAEVGARAFGDPDAVSVGDLHLPGTVSWALAGEPRATDERMLELLEPFRGQRGRVVRWIEAAGIRAPRFGPRMSPRRISGI